ncbi:acyltransferase [Arenimonas caeni]|jgi:predicted LPLAT superfamily acyltransferase|uniref:Acyltransferase n=1 Tax=Arenimonas caeni TaxID=2058085 RepID=A0A2P6MB64_9GAMM|nr:acyltransferase [Arenimonas caeni]MDY0021698.1 acyltransferase [Arenimonas caeni]PRH83227.1 acyltransferase [Arenimonas caeni]
MARHWAELGESTFVGGTWLLYGVHRLFGRWPFRLCLYPVVLVYWLGSPVARRASLQYLRRLHAHAPGVFDGEPGVRQSLRHFACFAETLLDKMLAIGGRYPRERTRFTGYEPMLAAAEAGQGGIIATAHMGCLELMQVAAGWRKGLAVSILVHTAHARRFNRILERLDPGAGVRLLQVTDFSPATAMMLADRVAAGEFIAIAGDRVPVAGDRTARVRFLGHPAELPAGPYLMASVLRCPVWLLSCQHDGDGYHARIELLAGKVELPRGQRQPAIDALAGRFADWMAARLRESPYDWFNFYPFWKSSDHVRSDDTPPAPAR